MTYAETITLLRALNIPKDAGHYSVVHKVRQYEQNIGKEIFSNIEDGASKIVLLPKDAPFVIKWTYGDAEYDEAYDEVLMYQKAVDAGLEKFFPKTAFLCEINGIKFVVQSKVDTAVCDLPGDTANRYAKIIKTAKLSLVLKMEKEFKKSCYGYGRDLNIIWGKMALTLYGKRMCKALCKFVRDNQINDLHEGNLGYKDNRPVILDFSGYHRDY